jgi:anti-sigma regulatory factor (Ser/Thr protein kinase)
MVTAGRGSSIDATLAGTTASVAEARRLVSDSLERAGIAGPLRRDIVIAVSEVVANAVIHAQRPPEPSGVVRLVATIDTGGVAVSVTDHGAGMDARPEGTHGGLGIPIAIALADRYSVSRTQTPPATTVKLEFRRPPPPIV